MRSAVATALFALATVVAAGPQIPPSAPYPAPNYPFTGGKWPVVTSQTNMSAAAIAPSVDPWYSAPSDYALAYPGQILKIRNATNLAPLIANASEAYQILYRTTDGAYTAAWAVTTLFVPFANYSGGVLDKHLSYQIPYDSADVDASPSYTLYSGGGYSGDASITAALGRGWVVSTTDFEGPNAYFTAGVFSGHATLDSIRAILSSQSPVNLTSDARTALWGYSGGALACEWAAELQVQYAPGLKIAGASLGGLTPNVTEVLYTINGTVYAGLVPAGIVGLLTQYPETTQFLYNNLNPTGTYNASRFLATKNYTLLESISAFVGQNMFDYFKNGTGLVSSPTAQMVINRDGIMGYHGVPQMPLFVYKAIGDDVSKIADTDALVNKYCGVGATIHYERNTVGNHQTESVYGEAHAVDFLISVLDGTYSAYGCNITDVTISS